MGQLKSGRRTVKTVFHLRGFKEVHMTDSFAFVLSRCPQLLELLLRSVGAQPPPPDAYGLLLQRSSQDKGRTDIEIVGPGYHLICEAKRGPSLPSCRQLTKYAQRLEEQGSTIRELLVLSDSEPGFAESRLKGYGLGVKVLFLSWRQVRETAANLMQSGDRAALVWLQELVCYLDDHLRWVDSPGNVRIVALSRRQVAGRALSSVELLKQQQRYVHPVGNGYPTRPARLLGFRYDGRLQSVHPVLNVQHVSTLPDDIAAPGKQISGSHYVYDLGVAIPMTDQKTPGVAWKIRSGSIRNRPLRLPLAMLGDFDTLEAASAHHAAARKQRRARRQAQTR